MYPNLSYLLHDIFGTQRDNWASVFQMFGVMLVVSILSAALFFYLELKRKAQGGLYQPTTVKTTIGEPASMWDLLSTSLFWFVLGFKGFYVFQNFAEFQKDAAAVVFSPKGNLLVGLGLAVVFGVLRWMEKKKHALPKPKEVSTQVYPHDRIGDLTIIAAITGILGAKVFAILEEPSGFFSDPIGTFFSGSGLAIYGGLIGGYLGVTWYMRKHNIAFWPTADAVAPALIIAYGMGRIGCQLSGDGDWGIEAAAQPDWWFLPDWFWAYDYPNNVNNANYFDGHSAGLGGLMSECTPGCEVVATAKMKIEDACQQCCGIRYCHQLIKPVYPTPLYETIASFLIGGFLWAIRKRVQVPGMIFFIYLLLNGFERFWIEKIRVNATYNILGFEPTQAEIIAVILFIVGVVGIVWRKRVYARA